MTKVIIAVLAVGVLLTPALLTLFGRARVRACCPADPAKDRRMSLGEAATRGDE
jgi:hypothetical protein